MVGSEDGASEGWIETDGENETVGLALDDGAFDGEVDGDKDREGTDEGTDD